MIGYAERHHLSPVLVAVYRRACTLVERVSHTARDGSEVRCHELARAVAHRLAVGGSAAEVVDGSLWCVEHTWILLQGQGERALLDVYAPGRVPQVQLLHDHPVVSRGYERGPERRDVRQVVVDDLLLAMGAEDAETPGALPGEATPPRAGFYWARRSSGGAWTVVEVSRVGDDYLLQAVGEACDRSDYFGEATVAEWGPRIESPSGSKP